MTQAVAFSVNVEVTNPGQVFACCGVLELAHRLWPGAEGWFDPNRPVFCIATTQGGATLGDVISALGKCEISGLSASERQERADLEAEGSRLKKQKAKLSAEKEARRKELGTEAREGKIQIGQPFDLILNWWQTGDDDSVSPKTWAGRQELHKVARAAQEALSAVGDARELLDHGTVLRKPKEYCKNKQEETDAVEPFYFDARRFAHALDVGFSLDAQDAETIAHPGVELLSLIGLQRFRPLASPVSRSFEYWTWSLPLAAPVAAGVVCGAASIPGWKLYRFPLRFRDDRKRYKAFGFATPLAALEVIHER